MKEEEKNVDENEISKVAENNTTAPQNKKDKVVENDATTKTSDSEVSEADIEKDEQARGIKGIDGLGFRG